MGDRTRQPAKPRAEGGEHPVPTDPSEPLKLTCYVRSDVSAPVRRQVDGIQDRLRRLAGTELVANVDVEPWPPSEHAAPEREDARTRESLVGRFEEWAERPGYSVRPAIRHRSVSWVLGGDDATGSDVRVPVVLLALERARDGAATLDSVVPYTVPGEAKRTYTVADWVTAAERAVGTDRKGETETAVSAVGPTRP